MLIDKKDVWNTGDNLPWVVHTEQRQLNFKLWLITQSLDITGLWGNVCSIKLLETRFCQYKVEGFVKGKKKKQGDHKWGN